VSTINPTMARTEWLLLLALSVLWGGGFVFVGVLVKELPPLTIVLGRIGLAALALVAYVRLRGLALPASPGLWGAFFVMGLINALVAQGLIVWGQTHIDSGLASILVSATPLFSVVLAHFLTSEERATVARLAGVLLGVAGVAVLIGPEALQGLGQHAMGQLAVLAGALCYACAGIYGRRFKGLPPVIPAAGQATCAALILLPIVLVVERPWTVRPSAVAWAALLGLALVSTALANLIFFRVLAAAGATNVMLVNVLVPVSALLLGALVLGERPSWTAFAGMACIAAGLLTIDGRVLQYLRRTPGQAQASQNRAAKASDVSTSSSSK
jgi:drug/metabolite transporter (DMT)-like permease